MGPSGSFDYRAADLVAVNSALNREFYPVRVRLVLLASTLGVILAATYAGAGLGLLLNLDPAMILLLGVAGLGLGVVLQRPLGMRAARWASRQAESARSREGQILRFELGDEGLRISSATGESMQRWEGVFKVMEKSGALIFVVGASAHFIPLRSLASADERKAAIEWILAHLTAEARARSTLRASS